MKKMILALSLLIFVGSLGFSQSTRFTPIDKSPMDMCYFPINYPVLKIQNKATEPLIARVIFSRPMKNGRTVFGELVEYGKVWRLGANEATEIEFYRDIKIGLNKIKKGRYTMYAIPQIDKWTIILNKELDIWGAFQYDAKKDVLRIDVKVDKLTEPTDAFTMQFEKQGVKTGANLIIAWDDVTAKLPINW